MNAKDELAARSDPEPMRDVTNEQTIAGSGRVPMDGYLYLLVNQYVPTLVKIGYTDRDPHVRAAELSGTTGVPGQWVVRHCWLLENAFEWEQRIFLALRKHRETGEFFKISAEIAIGRIEALLLQAGAINASGISAAARRELARKDAAKRQEEQRLFDKQQEQIAEQYKQRQFDAAWEQGWPTHVQPWCTLVHFCGEQMKTYSRPGLLHKMVHGNIDTDVRYHLLRFLGWQRRRLPSTQDMANEINELIPHLRKWHGYPRLLALLPEMFTVSRRAREFILYLNSQYGRRTPSGWGGNGPCCKRSEYWHGGEWYEKPDIMFLLGMPETWPTLEIRLAAQKVFGLSGDEATALLESEPTIRSTLMGLATNSPPPESRYGKHCIPYG